MPLTQQLRKLVRHVDEEGVSRTSRAVSGHLVRTASHTLEGTPGYYCCHRWRLSRRYDSADLTPVWISPEEITSLTGSYERRDQGHLDYVPYFKPRESNWSSIPYREEVPYGARRGGDWDRQQPPFSNLLLYRGTRQRFLDGVDWEDTVYYTQHLDRFRADGWSDSDAKTLARERCERIERVYDTIEQDGYQSQRALDGHPLHEVTVTVGRNGEVLYNCEGRHRLSIAKVLDIPEIPVLVLVCHEEFDGTVGTRNGRSPDQQSQD